MDQERIFANGDLIAFSAFSYDNPWGGTGLSAPQGEPMRGFEPDPSIGCALGVVTGFVGDYETGGSYVVKPADKGLEQYLLDKSRLDGPARVWALDAKEPSETQRESAKEFEAQPRGARPGWPVDRRACAARLRKGKKPSAGYGLASGAVIRLGGRELGICHAKHDPESGHSIYQAVELSPRTGKPLKGRLTVMFDSCSLDSSKDFEPLGYIDTHQSAAKTRCRGKGIERSV